MATGAKTRWVALAMLAGIGSAGLAYAGKLIPPEIEEIRQAHPEWAKPSSAPQGRNATPAAIPDVYGPGAVLNVGDVVMKVTNNGYLGNPFTNTSSDPSGQWPGTSGVEYLFFIAPAVAAVNPNATDPAAVRRVSYAGEWWPPSPDPEDRIYRSYDGAVNGARFVNDDGDRDPITLKPLIDEDFLDGRDNDGDGKIDEDYAALGQEMFSCVMRDDTPAAQALVGLERHIPFGLELRQLTWAYSVKPFTDFDAIEWTIYNRSGHTLDSMYIGFRADMDCGPVQRSNYYNDDVDIPFAPSGEFRVRVEPEDPKFQLSVGRNGGLDTLCPFVNVRVNGWSVADNDGDQGMTPGVPSLLLLGHTTDPLGLKAPRRVGFRAFRSFIGGTPYTSNGNPLIDQQRTEFMRSQQNIDPETGFINADPGDQDGDYSAWAAAGPFLSVPAGGSIQATIAFAVARGDRVTLDSYPKDYALYKTGRMSLDQLFEKYPIVENAFAAQVAYEGKYEPPPAGFEDKVPNCHGCESAEKLPQGSTPIFESENCPGREPEQKQVTDTDFTWFDFDCDPCTGVWDEFKNQGYFLRHWVAESPPPAPNLNVSATYNYSENPDRVVASGDNQITLAWDNLSEVTADPKTGIFDFRSYKVWKVANWRRPVGSSGPNDDDWTLLADFRFFDYADSNKQFNPDSGRATCPQVLIPNLNIKDVVLLKSSFATKGAADAWVASHGYRTDGASEESDRWRYRQEVGPCRPNTFHTKDLDVGVTAEICGVVGPSQPGVTVPICLFRGDFWDKPTACRSRAGTFSSGRRCARSTRLGATGWSTTR
ncbi:MAG: hypothetical protein E6K78_06550 [Candidatus Eisenbacteria bacterium]|uniref:Uncharacterized protein n=1 Tax=Eiseniibacteriota bacterium TaxID=2212470 RepID=A0A538TRY2_UNCEI|nr:MAG: hypothetical protein E6K78_06550 [Candidatus Eisenbacteria bacterium]